jgi:mitochondrial GTPase 1
MSKDLGCPSTRLSRQQRNHIQEQEETIRAWNHPSPALFVDARNGQHIHRVLKHLASFALSRQDALTPATALVVGMPNVGKSTLLNALRKKGKLGRAKVARTGAQPGVTRRVGTAVKIVEGYDERGNVYVLDTPGVFVPYVPDQEAMLRLALVGCVKDGLVPPVTLAEYLLFRMNLVDPALYKEYAAPTNDVVLLLEGMARKLGRYTKGGETNLEAAAVWMVQRWRTGHLGRFVLDDVTPEGMQVQRERELNTLPSMSQARKAARDAVRSKVKQQDLAVV